MANILNLWRVNLRVLERSASATGVTRADMLALLRNLNGITPSDRQTLTRLFTLCPRGEWVDVIKRQPGYEIPEDKVLKKSSQGPNRRRCPVCNDYCSNRPRTPAVIRREGQWYHVTCLDNLTN